MSTIKKNNSKYKKLFGESLKRIRESKGLSQIDLASLCYMEKSSISRLENGRTNATLTTIIVLSSALEIHPKEFFDFEIQEN